MHTLNARDFATLAHFKQVRKTTGQPYILHPAEVANILENYQASAAMIDAGWTHDTLEDTWLTRDLLIQVCGEKTANIVSEVTECKYTYGQKVAWKIRKERTIELLPTTSFEAQWVRCADVISNLRGLFRDGSKDHNIWNAFNASREEILWYYHSCLSRIVKVPTAMLAEGWLWYKIVDEKI